MLCASGDRGFCGPEGEARAAARAVASWLQYLGEKRCGSVFTSWEKRRGSRVLCASGDRGCCGEIEGEARAAARAVASVVGREALRARTHQLGGIVEGVVCGRRQRALWQD